VPNIRDRWVMIAVAGAEGIERSLALNPPLVRSLVRAAGSLARKRKMFSKIKIAFSAAIVLSATFPASAATKYHRVTHARPAIHNMVSGYFPGCGCCSPIHPHFAVTFARGLALVQDQIAGDECSGGQEAATGL
jgi:hypothetical protein